MNKKTPQLLMQHHLKRENILVSPYTSSYPPGPNAVLRTNIISLTTPECGGGWVQDIERAGKVMELVIKQVGVDKGWRRVVFYPPTFRFTTAYLYVDYYVDSESNAALETNAQLLYHKLKTHLDSNPKRDFLSLAGEVLRSSPFDTKTRTMILYNEKHGQQY